ncbi:hypothetical protein KM043_004005 [Ampulex compressa]|nr:hypothetical protein KM043_004005 [Ampulex compressa]
MRNVSDTAEMSYVPAEAIPRIHCNRSYCPKSRLFALERSRTKRFFGAAAWRFRREKEGGLEIPGNGARIGRRWARYRRRLYWVRKEQNGRQRRRLDDKVTEGKRHDAMRRRIGILRRPAKGVIPQWEALLEKGR